MVRAPVADFGGRALGLARRRSGLGARRRSCGGPSRRGGAPARPARRRAQPGEGGGEHERPVAAAGGVRDGSHHFDGGHAPLGGALLARSCDHTGVRDREPVGERGGEDRAQEPVGLGCGGRPVPGDPRIPGADRSGRDLGERHLGEGRQQVTPEETAVQLDGVRAQLVALVQPGVGVGGEEEPAAGGVRPDAAADVRLGRCQPGQGVGLGRERPAGGVPGDLVPLRRLAAPGGQLADRAAVASTRSHGLITSPGA